MKRLTQLRHSLLLLFIICGITSAQTAGDYRTHQTGNWNDLNTWEKYNGTTWDYPAAEMPDSNSAGAASIMSGDTVTVTATVGIHNVMVDSGGYVIVNGNPVVLYIASGGMTVKGTLIVTGITNTAVPYSVTNSTGTLTIGNGGVLQYSQTHGTASQKGALPVATWSTGSTCLITSAGGTGATSFNSGGPQNFYNLIWNCPAQTGNFGFGFSNNTISGNVDIVTTNTGRFYFFGGSNGTLRINGDFTFQAGQFASHGSGSQTFDTVYFNGKIKAVAGNFSLSRGSQSSGTGTTIWYVNGDSMIVNGASTITMQNSNYGLGNTKIYFSKKGSQVVKLNNVSITGYTAASSGSGFPFEVLDSSITKFVLSNITYGGSGASFLGQVDSGGTIDLDTSKIAGTSNFTLNNGGTINSANIYGLDSSLSTTGTKSLSKKANYVFSGSTSQIPGSLLPDTMNGLWISNPAGLTLRDTFYCNWLNVTSGALLRVDTIGILVADTGAVNGTIWNADSLYTSKGFVFGSGAVYEHARNSGVIPQGIWNSGSLCNVTGMTSASSIAGGGDQDFYNFEWNCPNQTGNASLGLYTKGIHGTLTLTSSGTGRFYLMGGSSGTATLYGNFIQTAGNFGINGTGSQTFDTVNCYGNVTATGGNWSVTRGSQSSGTGTSVWNMFADLFSLSGMTTQVSNTVGAKLVFAKQGQQTLKLSNVTFGGGGLPVEVNNGTTLDLDTSFIGGAGAFIADSGATLICRHANGLNGNIATTGTVSLSSKANYTYGGSVSQVTGVLLPLSINTLTIDNAEGVILSGSVVVNSNLNLTNGKLSIGNNMLTVTQLYFVVGPTDKYIITNGTGKLKYAFVDTMGSTMVDFPVGTVDSYAPVLIINNGVQDTFAVRVSSDTSNGLNRVKLKWDIAENTEGGTNASVQFSWMPNVEGAVFAANRNAFAKIYLLSTDTTEAGSGDYKLSFDTPLHFAERDGITNSGTYVIGKFGTITSVGTENLTEVPIEYKLYQNYPNPFNPSTTIKFTVAKAGMTRVKVYNALGQVVATLFNQIAEPGKYYSVQMNAHSLSSGMYFSVFESEGHREIKKMMLLK